MFICHEVDLVRFKRSHSTKCLRFSDVTLMFCGALQGRMKCQERRPRQKSHYDSFHILTLKLSNENTQNAV